MSFSTTSAPGGFSRRTQDNSRRPIPATPIVSSMTAGLYGILAERGRGDVTYVTSGAAEMYGAKTFQKDSAYYHHSNFLLEEMTKLGVPGFVKRFIPEGASKAMLRVSLEIITTDINVYARNSDGSIQQVVDPVTGIGNPVILRTVAGTRGIIHVGTAAYALENRKFAAGNIVDNYRDGSVTVAGKVLGEVTRADLTKEFSKSRLIPLFDLEIDSEGNYGNNIGLVVEVPTLKQATPVDVAEAVHNRAFPIRVGVVERPDRFSTPVPVPKLDQDLVQDVFFKPKATGRITGKNASLATVMVDGYSSKQTKDATAVWGPFGATHVYTTNINEIQQLLSEGYTYTDLLGGDIIVAGEAAYDAEAFDYGRTTDYAFTNPLNYGYLNFLTARDFNNVPYFGFDVRDTLLFGGVAINDSSVLFASGGEDGLWSLADGTPAELVNLKILDDAMKGFLNNFGDGTDKVNDILRFPITGIIDSGWSIETKLAMSKVLAARPDITLAVGTQSVADVGPLPVDIGPVHRGSATAVENALSSELLDGWDFQKRLTGDEDEAVAVRLRTFFGLTPESTFFGTPTMRVFIIGESGRAVDGRYANFLPGSVDRGLAMAEFTGVTGWDKAADFTENDNRKPKFLKDLSYTYRGNERTDSSWSAGLNFLQSHDIQDNFWPAIQSIYVHQDSILSNPKFVLAAARCHYFGMEVWRSISGENKTDAQFKQELEEEAAALIVNRFTDDVLVIPEAILTEADIARGYSGYLKFHIGVGSARTKLVYSVHGYTLDQLNEMQGLPPA